MTVERRHLNLDGLRLSYLERGQESKDTPSLVLLHGLMGCAETFLPLIAAIPPNQHVIAIDLPGAGHSERRDTLDADLASTARQVDRAIHSLSLRKPILLGHSHGGAVAMTLAAMRPARLTSLVLLAPAHPWFDEGDPLIRFYLSLPGRLFAYTMPWYPEWLQLIGLRRMAGPQSWDSRERLKPYRDNLRTPGTMSHLLRLLRSWHQDMSGLRRALRRPLTTPSLIVWGDFDRAVPLHSARKLCSHLLHSELHILPGIGHRPAEEVPSLVAALLDPWLAPSAPTLAPDSIRYSPNSSATHPLIAPLMTSSFEPGD